MKILDTAILITSQCEQCQTTFTDTYSADSIDEVIVEVVAAGCHKCGTAKTRQEAMQEVFG